jgi:hypothetical protein
MGAKKKQKKLPGRSLLSGDVTLGEIQRLTKPFGDQAEALFDEGSMEGSEYDVLVVDGPLHIEGDFDTFQHKLCGLVVVGDFTVDGVYLDYDDPATGVFVLGNMKAGRVITTGALGVKKSLTVPGSLVGFYNDYSADIGGDVTCECFYPENHHFSIGKKLNAKYVLGSGAEWRVSKHLKASTKPLAAEQWAKVLHASVISGDEEDPELDYDAFKERVTKGLPVTR